MKYLNIKWAIRQYIINNPEEQKRIYTKINQFRNLKLFTVINFDFVFAESVSVLKRWNKFRIFSQKGDEFMGEKNLKRGSYQFITNWKSIKERNREGFLTPRNDHSGVSLLKDEILSMKWITWSYKNIKFRNILRKMKASKKFSQLKFISI